MPMRPPFRPPHLPRPLAGLTAAVLLLAAAASPAQTVVAPVSYDMPNGYGQAHGGSFNYWDRQYTGSGSTTVDFAPLSGGLGDLSDGVIAGGRWDEVENTDGTGPYVGWSAIDPVIVFHFDRVHSFSRVVVWHDDADGYGNVATPAAFTVTVGARSQRFEITDPPGDRPFASTLVLDTAFSGSSLELQVHRFDTATMLSEVQISAVPEPAAAASLLAGLGLLAWRRQRLGQQPHPPRHAGTCRC